MHNRKKSDENTEKLSDRARALINEEFRKLLLNKVYVSNEKLAVASSKNASTCSASKVNSVAAVRTARKKIQEEWDALKNATIISNEKTPERSEVLIGVVIYIAINNVPKSVALKVLLEKLGATVKDNFVPEVTHVIFKNGPFEVFKKAKFLNVHLVSVQWIEACKNSGKRCDEKLFPVSEYKNYIASPRSFQELIKTVQKNKENLIAKLASELNLKTKQQTKRISNQSNNDSTESDIVLHISSDTSGEKANKNNGQDDTTTKSNENLISSNESSVIQIETDISEESDNISQSLLSKSPQTQKKRRLFSSANDYEIDIDKNVPKQADIRRKLFNTNISQANITTQTSPATPAPNVQVINPYKLPETQKTKTRRKVRPNTQKKKEMRPSAEERRQGVRELLKMTKEMEKKSKRYRNTPKPNLPDKINIDADTANKNVKITRKEKEAIRRTCLKQRRERILLLTQPKSCRKLMNSEGSHKPSIVTTYLHKAENKLLQEAINRLGGFKFKATVSRDTTHVICGDAVRTMNVLRGVAHGCWVVSKGWLEDSLAAGYWLMEHPYELTQLAPALQRNRLERQALGEDYLCDVFRNTIFYIGSACKPSCEAVRQLAYLCGGKISEQSADADLVIGERLDHPACVSERWLFDSVFSGRPKTLKKYLLV